MAIDNVIWILAIIAAIWVIIDVWSRRYLSKGMRIFWTIMAILFSIITAIFYYFIEKR